MHIVHVVRFLVGLLYPLLPITCIIVSDALQQQKNVITLGKLGFGITTFPPILCTDMNPPHCLLCDHLPQCAPHAGWNNLPGFDDIHCAQGKFFVSCISSLEFSA